MPASSPYQQNDYQALSTFRPYQLPVNDIMKAFVAQNQFWDEGARRVKNVYENALDLQLTKEGNKEIRDNYLKEAEKQLTKLSSMDLSDPSVQRQGFAIFKPLFQDEGILSDDQATRHINKVNSDALSYRDKDNGKFYSSTNHQYALTGAHEFQDPNNTDRFAGKKYLENRKEYEPFYDPANELNNVLKNCRPDKATNASVKGFYIDSYSIESLSAAKINTCLDAGLSDKARRQLQINGAVTYRNNPEALRDKYIPHLQGTRSQLSQERAAIDGVLANKDSLATLKKEDLNKLGLSDVSQVTPQLIQSLQETRRNIDNRINNINQTTAQLLNGDFSSIQGENFEPIAGAMYSRDYMQNVGEGFSYNFQTNTKKADPVQMLFFREAQENARQEDKQKFDAEWKQKELDADLMMKMLGGAGKGGAPTSLKDIMAMPGGQAIIDAARTQNVADSPFSTIAKADSYDQVTQKRVDVAKQRQDVNRWLISKLKNYGLPSNITRTDQPEYERFWANFKTTVGNDPVKKQMMDTYYARMDPLMSFEDTLKNTQDIVDSKIKPLEQSLVDKVSKIDDKANVNGTVLSSMDVLNALTGKTSPLKVVQGKPYYPTGAGGGGKPVLVNEYYVNGKKLSDREFTNLLQPLFNKVAQQRSSSIEEIKSRRNELMQQETVLQKESYNFAYLNDNEGNFKKTIAQAIGLQSKYIDDLTIGATDAAGNVLVTLNRDRAAAKKEYDADVVFNKLKIYNSQDNQVLGDDLTPNAKGNTVLVKGIDALKAINENNLSDIMRPYVRSLEGKAALGSKSESTGPIRSGNGRSYRLEVDKGLSPGTYTYTIIDISNPTSPVYSSEQREDALRFFEGSLNREQPKVQVPNAR